MTARELEDRYASLRDARAEGRLTHEAFEDAVHALRFVDRDGHWYQIDPADGGWLRWDGAAWSGAAPPQAAAEPPPPAPTRRARTSVRDQGASKLTCARCGAWLPRPTELCADCEAGRSVRRREEPGPSYRPARLLLFVPVLIFAYVARDHLRDSLPVLGLLAATVILAVLLRRTVAVALYRVARLPLFKPIWSITGPLPTRLRRLLGIAVPAVFAYWITPKLSLAFEGSGFLVFVVALTGSTFLAVFFFGPPPRPVRA